eukprot:s2297_g4.t1
MVFVGLAAGMQMLLLWSAVVSCRSRLVDIRLFGAYLWKVLRAALRGLRPGRKPRKKTEYEEMIASEMHSSRERLAFGLICMYAAICFAFLLLIQIQIEEVWVPSVCWALLGHAGYFLLCIWMPCLLSWDIVYIFFMISTLFYLSPWVSELEHYVDGSWTLVLVLRIPSVIIPRNISSVLFCNFGFFVMTCTRIFLEDWSIVQRESPLRNPLTSRVLVMELLSSLAILAFAVLVKAFLKKSAEKSVEVGASSKLSQQLNAATALLHLCCDAVVELDSRLRLRKHSSELAAMLLRDFQGASLAEMKLTDFMPPVDASKAMTYLQDFRSTSNSSMSFESRDNKQAHAFISRMVDSGATKLKVEIFQVMYRNPGGETCHLVGIRDITDSKPFVSDEEMSDVTIPFQEQASESRSGELDMSLRSSQARVCLDLDVGEFMRVASATAPLTHIVGASIEKIFPQSICMLMKRICDEGRLFLDRNEPLPGKTFSFESLPAQWSADRNPEDISGFFQLARNVSGNSHVLMFFTRGNRQTPPGSPLSPVSPWSLSPPSMSRRSSNRSNRERGTVSSELRDAERPRSVVHLASLGRGSPRTPQPTSTGHRAELVKSLPAAKKVQEARFPCEEPSRTACGSCEFGLPPPRRRSCLVVSQTFIYDCLSILNPMIFCQMFAYFCLETFKPLASR